MTTEAIQAREKPQLLPCPFCDQEVYETLIWRGDIIPRSEQEVALSEDGERFREAREGKDDEDYDEQDFDSSNPEHLCIKCGTRERIVNQVCGMCSELHPNMV